VRGRGDPLVSHEPFCRDQGSLISHPWALEDDPEIAVTTDDEALDLTTASLVGGS
jgi:hypothetical protein